MEQAIINGIMNGWIYVLVALGMTLVFGVMKIIQLAHGELYMLGAFVIYYFCVEWGLNFFVALLVCGSIMGIVGILMERFVFRPYRGDFENSILIATGLIMFFQTTALLVFGSWTHAVPSFFEGVVTIFGARLSIDRLVAIVIAILLVVALLLILEKTKIGQAMVAVSQEEDAAALQGINVNRMCSIGMALGSALAGIAGGLMASILTVQPFMGGFAMGKGIVVIILGGMGSVPGAILGGLLLGMIDGIGAPIIGTIPTNLVGVAVLILILLIRPRGLLGRESGQKE